MTADHAAVMRAADADDWATVRALVAGYTPRDMRRLGDLMAGIEHECIEQSRPAHMRAAARHRTPARTRPATTGAVGTCTCGGT